MKKRLLVVEDDSTVRLLLRRILERAGYELSEEGEGRRALERVESASSLPDAILLDLSLPDMSGFEVLTQLSHIAPDIPVLILASPAELEQSIEAMRKGAADSLTKPFASGEVLVRVERAFQRRVGLRLSLDKVEQAHIEAVLKSTGGNKYRAAEILQIDRSTLYSKLKKYREQ